jgi:hypothetical protein
LIIMAKAKSASNAPKLDTPTRARSVKLIAALDPVKDRAALEEYLKNPSKRLQSQAAYKLADPAARAGMTAEKNAKKKP